MVVREALPAIEDWRVELFASDLRGQAIMTASRGRYRATAIRGIDPTLRNRYFIGVDEPGPDREFDVIPRVRRMVTFRRANLYEPHVWRQLPGPYDLILCENLLIYFHPRAVEVLVDRLAEALAQGGYLVVNSVEADLISRAVFRPVESLPAGFFQTRAGSTG
jgi:chemotaxis protein methyltransferase CheR